MQERDRAVGGGEEVVGGLLFGVELYAVGRLQLAGVKVFQSAFEAFLHHKDAVFD